MQTDALRSALDVLRIVVLTGSRQTGKTTLVRRLGDVEDRPYVTLDRPETLELAERDPEALWIGRDRLTIDEVQRSPRLLDYLKIEVDRRPEPGRFLLTGSANLLLMRAISDSLAGRAGYISLPPLTRAEQLERNGGRVLAGLLGAQSVQLALTLEAELEAPSDEPDLAQLVFDGGYPEVVTLPTEAARNIWREGYVTTYLERDLRDLSQIADLPDFFRLLRLAVLRSGQLVNIDSLARDAGLSSSTARRYLNLLEVGFQIVKLPALTTSRSKRLIKSPRLFAADSGLACYLCGITSSEALQSSSLLGSLFETFILHHVRAFADLMPIRANVLYWRTTGGKEVDIVVEAPTRLLPIEVKASRSLGKNDLRGLRAFLDELPDLTPFGVVLYGGDEWMLVQKDILALPWRAFISS